MGLQKYGTGDGKVLLEDDDAEPTKVFTRTAKAELDQELEPQEVASEDS